MIEKLYVRTEVNKDMLGLGDNYHVTNAIRHDLIVSLAQEIFKSKAVRFDESYDPIKDRHTITAMIKVDL